jgi:polyhydroxybutyrate depolymerase
LHESDIDDVQFIRDLLKYLKAQYSIDENRVFAAGFSGGGRMASRLACDMSESFAAIAPVAGLRFPEKCSPKRAVPIITFHGKLDNINHYQWREDSPKYWREGVESALTSWVGFNRCDTGAQLTRLSDALIKLDYSNCEGDVRVVFYRSEDSGHTWPGSPGAALFEQYGLGKAEMSISATERIWGFFSKNSLQ